MTPPNAELAAWRGVETAIENLLPYYERVNSVNTFGRLRLWRERLARTSNPDGAALEIGSGTGGFARLVRARRLYCIDPSGSMLRMARRRLTGNGYRFLSGVAERLPIQMGSLDQVYCSFSFRDFLDKRTAVTEIARVLRPGGEFHVLDAAPPPPGLRRAFMDSWLNYGVPTVVAALVPRRERKRWGEPPFRAFVRTYEAMDAPEAYADLLRRSGFEDVRLDYLSMHSIFHLRGVRARTT